MSRINGSALLLDINIATEGNPADWKTICGATSHSIDYSTAMEDATSKCSGGHEDLLPGLSSTTINVDALEDPDNEFSFEDLLTYYKNKTEIQVRCYLSPNATKYEQGMVLIESVGQQADMESVVSYNTTLRVKTPGLETITPT